MKKISAWLMMLLMSFLALPTLAHAAVPAVQLFMDGRPLLAEVPPQIVGGNTIVPVRIIAESIGSNVAWEAKERRVTINKEETSIQLFIDKKNAIVNEKSYLLETAPAIVEGNTMLPLRFVSEQLGVEVTWEEATRSVFLYKPKPDTTSGQDKEIAGGAGKGGESGSGAAGGTTGKEGIAADAPKDSAAGQTKEPSAEPSKDQAKDPVKDPSKDSSKDASKDQPAFLTDPGAPVKAGDTSPANTATGGKPSETAPPGADKPVAPGESLVMGVVLQGDTVTVKTTDKTLKPKAFQLAEPYRIVIDVPKAKLAESLASKVGPNKEGTVSEKNEFVSQIRYSLFSNEPSIVRIVIDLPKKYEFSMTDMLPSGEFAVKLGQPGQVKSKYRVVIDPGHGGTDTGAISVTKRSEKDFVLPLATKVVELLQKESKIEVVMTRSNDTFIELSDRAGKANDIGADLFVSIHGNSATKENVSGTETYYYTPQSQDFANLMHKYLLEGTGFPDRKVKKESFHVIRNTTMPSVLLEIGFLSNRSDEAQLYSDSFQDKVAASIVAAIKKQLNID
ncbi:hypothetical protein PAESOLCIP111_01361 [Paenibacillus solanacearum]|uniref:MurNAc-LAA domain-containing protein n=1 Tax=Paenibacillus solanacearum TaxID=2048548 RepID=A0A916JY11_9BACL|nr:N-acetylmuramoyl-L-alanine amidase family protein [Paenibacillus solanacearum]CAG7611308.1 hypothetical protein PAESOLCIP111_01361 [Paenibacillus solanacearum]